MEKPARRFRLDLFIEADTMEQLSSALFNLSTRADREELSASGVSGGYSSGYVYTLTDNPEMTHDRYVACLNEYLTQAAPPNLPPA